MAKVTLTDIVIDETIYPRSAVNEFNVNRLVAALKTGAMLPPITMEAATRRLVDGRHRYEAYQKEGLKTIEVIEKVYASEADLFADAVRCNIGHGQPLDQYTVRNAIIRLTEYGYQREQISEVVRLPTEYIEKIERGFAVSQDGKPLALKGGLSHLKGHTLDPQQMAVNKHYSGGKAIFYVRQLCELIENEMAPESVNFAAAMDRLITLWTSPRLTAARSGQPQSQAVSPT